MARGARRPDAHDLPSPDAGFAAVTASFALMHLGRPEVAVAEWARVLEPAGRLAVTVWTERPRVTLIGEVLDALDASAAPWPAAIPDGPSFFRFSDDDERRALLGADFAEAAITTVSFTHRVPDAAAVWDGILNSSVRTRRRHPGPTGPPPRAHPQRLHAADGALPPRRRAGAAHLGQGRLGPALSAMT